MLFQCYTGLSQSVRMQARIKIWYLHDIHTFPLLIIQASLIQSVLYTEIHRRCFIEEHFERELRITLFSLEPQTTTCADYADLADNADLAEWGLFNLYISTSILVGSNTSWSRQPLYRVAQSL